MPSKSQSGFSAILIVILLAIIAGSSVVIIKNIPNNQPKPIPIVEKQSTDSGAQIKTSPSPTISKTPTPITPKQATPTPTKTTTVNNTSNNSNSNTNTSTPNPTNTPTPTPIPSPTATPQPVSPYVRVIYPNGEESFTVGDNLTVTWETNMPMGNCSIQTIDANNSGTDISGGGVNVTNKSISWTATIGNTPLTEKKLKIYMICHDFNGGTQFATSNNYFTVHK